MDRDFKRFNDWVDASIVIVMSVCMTHYCNSPKYNVPLDFLALNQLRYKHAGLQSMEVIVLNI